MLIHNFLHSIPHNLSTVYITWWLWSKTFTSPQYSETLIYNVSSQIYHKFFTVYLPYPSVAVEKHKTMHKIITCSKVPIYDGKLEDKNALPRISTIDPGGRCDKPRPDEFCTNPAIWLKILVRSIHSKKPYNHSSDSCVAKLVFQVVN